MVRWKNLAKWIDRTPNAPGQRSDGPPLRCALLFFLLLLRALASLAQTPDDIWTRAFLDLEANVERADQPYSRYLYAPDDSVNYPGVVGYAANATSFRSEMGPVQQLGGRLLKLDLRGFGWDFGSRVKRLAELERRGVRFDPARRADLLDPWEVLARADPYFVADHYDNSVYHRGWLDRDRVNAARGLSRSLKFVLRTDFVIPRLLTEKSQGGIYSDLLLLPDKEADLFKALLIDIAAVERDGQLRQGGAILTSIVALHNRELEMLPSLYGHGGNKYLWVTHDFNSDERGNKSVLEAFAGTVKRDGREDIGSLPNGLTFTKLFDGAGNTVDAVPETIAQIKISQDNIRETRVINSYSCIKCHQQGIRDFEDVVRKAFLNQPSPLNTKAKSQYAADELSVALAEYYSSTLNETIRTQQQAYAVRLKAACGMTGNEASQAVVEAVESYGADLVDPARGAVEMGYTEDFAKLAWMAASVPYQANGVHYAGNSQLAVLAGGQAIRRAAWESSFSDSMLAAIRLKKVLGANPKEGKNRGE